MFELGERAATTDCAHEHGLRPCPLPHVFVQSIQNRMDKSGPRFRMCCKVLISKSCLCKVFQRCNLARLGWPGREFGCADFGLAPRSHYMGCVKGFGGNSSVSA